MSRKPRNTELEMTSDHQEVTPESEIETEPTPVDDELERFKCTLATMSSELLSQYKAAIDGETAQRQRQEMEKVLRFFKTLSKENQEIFLNSVQTTTLKREFETSESERQRKEKNPFRMYQNYPSDENAEYKIAPLVNLELKSVFTGGNPKNKTWLADLSVEERREQFGTITKLEADSSFLNELMTVPKAVFKLQDGAWVDCYEE